MKKNLLLKSLRLPSTPSAPGQKKKVEVFEGFFVDAEMNSKIVLMALSKGVSKSQLLRDVFHDWLKDKDPITEVVEYVKVLKQEYDVSNAEFVTKLKDLLRDRGVSQEQSGKILKRIKELK